MKKSALLLISVFLFFNLHSQEETRRFSFGVEVNPKVVLQIFDNNWLMESNSLVGGSATLGVYMNIHSRVLIKTGVSFETIGINQKDYFYTLGCDYDGSGNIDYQNSWLHSNFSQAYLGTPLETRIRLSEKSCHPYIKTGGSMLLYLGQSGVNNLHVVHQCSLTVTDGPGYIDPQPAPILFVADFGIGYEFCLSESMKAFIEPNLEYSLNHIFEKPFLPNLPKFVFENSRMMNVGLVVGVRM